MRNYHKIETLFKRDMKGTKKLIEGDFLNSTYEFLKDVPWQFTEKVDGTNIRIHWDSNEITFAGRLPNSSIPAPLQEHLDEIFGTEAMEQVFEQLFACKKVTLFGEGYGDKIQSKAKYEVPASFILFDVYFEDTDVWAKRSVVEDIAMALGVPVAPVVLEGTLGEGVAYVKSNPVSTLKNDYMEGVVARPMIELKDNNGNRIIAKIKARDFVDGGKR